MARQLRIQYEGKSSRRKSGFQCAAIRSAVVWRAAGYQQRNRLRQLL